MSEWLLINANSAICQLYLGENKLIFNEMMTRPDLYQTNALYSASSLKQQHVDRQVVTLGHIILLPSQPVFALSLYCCVLSGEDTNTNFIDFSSTRPWLGPMIYHTRGEHANHYTTDAGQCINERQQKNWLPFSNTDICM